MTEKEMTDEELEDELEKDLKANESKRDKCGTPMPSNQEVGLQRDKVKLKDQ